MPATCVYHLVVCIGMRMRRLKREKNQPVVEERIFELLQQLCVEVHEKRTMILYDGG